MKEHEKKHRKHSKPENWPKSTYAVLPDDGRAIPWFYVFRFRQEQLACLISQDTGQHPLSERCWDQPHHDPDRQPLAGRGAGCRLLGTHHQPNEDLLLPGVEGEERSTSQAQVCWSLQVQVCKHCPFSNSNRPISVSLVVITGPLHFNRNKICEEENWFGIMHNYGIKQQLLCHP